MASRRSFDPLASRILLAQPHRLTDVGFWHEHIPFAFLLIELTSPRVFVELGTWKGDSYCAFCQAIAGLEIDARCYAVDTWEGDDHTGSYPREALEELRAYHDPVYGAFSRLIVSTFDEALEHFADESVDLLHIDGAHSYASVSHDFETWRPKLSERGVVLLHDTNMRENNFGVRRLWDELSADHPSFEFFHGHGLGVLALGGSTPQPLIDWIEAANCQASDVRRLFFALGDHVAARGRDESYRAHLTTLRTELAGMQASDATLRSELDGSRASDAAARSELGDTRNRLEAAQSQLEAARSELEAARSELATTRSYLAAHQSEAETVRTELGRRDAQIAAIYNSPSWRLSAPLRALRPIVRPVARRLRPRRSPSPTSEALEHGEKPERLLALAPALLGEHDLGHLLTLAGEETVPIDLRDEYVVLEARHWAKRNAAARDFGPNAQPLVSVLLPTYNTDPHLLREAVSSVLAQTYPRWELCIVDDASTSTELIAALADLATWDDRIRVRLSESHSGIAATTNAALKTAEGEFVAMLDHDDVLLPGALFEVVQRIDADPGLDAIYTDQCYIDPDGTASDFLAKPNWSPVLFCGVMYVGHLLVVRRDLAVDLGGFDSNFDNVQDFEFMLRLSEKTSRIGHVPHILYGWRRAPGSVALRANAKPEIEALQARAVSAHLRRRGVPAIARSSSSHVHRVELLPAGGEEANLVAVYVAGSATRRALRATVRSIDEHRSIAVCDVITPGVQHRSAGGQSRVRRQPESFSEALANSDATHVLCIEEGIVVESREWFAHLLLHTRFESVAMVAPVVIASDGSIEESGRVLVPAGPLPAMRGCDPASDGHAGTLSCAREVAAVSGVCALVPRDVLESLGGLSASFDTLRYALIDLSLRALEQGFSSVVTPRVVVRRAVGQADNPTVDCALDREIITELWRHRLSASDPYHNPSILSSGGGSLARSGGLGTPIPA